MAGTSNHLSTSPEGFKKLKAHEAEIDGLYDDTSGYATFGVGHLVHPKGKYRCFMLAAALADPEWKKHVDYKVWSKKKRAKRMPFLPRRVGTVANASGLETKALAVAYPIIAKAEYHKGFDALSADQKLRVEALAKEAVAEERRLLTKTADHVFRDDLRPFEKTVNHGISGILLNQDEFDALVSFTFNVGSGNFSKSSLRKEINRATYRSGPVSGREAAINEITASFQKWNKSGGKVLEGLTRRRKAEADQFLKQARAEYQALAKH